MTISVWRGAGPVVGILCWAVLSIVLNACSAPEPEPMELPSPEAYLLSEPLPVRSLPPVCQIQRGAGAVRGEDVLVAGALRPGCHELTEEPVRFPRPMPFVGLSMSPAGKEAPLPWSADAVTFAFPVPDGGGGWSLIWGEPVATDAMTVSEGPWPEYVATRIYCSTLDGDGTWSTPDLVATSDQGFALASPMRNLALTDAGMALLIIDTGFFIWVRDSIQFVGVWTPEGGLIEVPFKHRGSSPSVVPVLGSDPQGHLWLSWADESSDATGAGFFLQDLGPDGMAFQEPVSSVFALPEDHDVGDHYLIFDGDGQPHIFWESRARPGAGIYHATPSGADDDWALRPVFNDAGVRPGGLIGGITPSRVDGVILLHSKHINPMAPDGRFGTVHRWAWTGEDWIHHGRFSGEDRTDLGLTPLFVNRGAGRWDRTALWTGTEVPVGLSVPDDWLPESRLYWDEGR